MYSKHATRQLLTARPICNGQIDCDKRQVDSTIRRRKLLRTVTFFSTSSLSFSLSFSVRRSLLVVAAAVIYRFRRARVPRRTRVYATHNFSGDRDICTARTFVRSIRTCPAMILDHESRTSACRMYVVLSDYVDARHRRSELIRGQKCSESELAVDENRERRESRDQTSIQRERKVVISTCGGRKVSAREKT